MPIKLTAYGCKFKCGGKVRTSKKAVEKHETWCYANPETRSCKSCKHKVNDPDYGIYCDVEVDITKKWKTNCDKHKLREN